MIQCDFALLFAVGTARFIPSNKARPITLSDRSRAFSHPSARPTHLGTRRIVAAPLPGILRPAGLRRPILISPVNELSAIIIDTLTGTELSVSAPILPDLPAALSAGSRGLWARVPGLSFALIAVLFDTGAGQAALSIPCAIPNISTAISAAPFIDVSPAPFIMQHHVMVLSVIFAHLLISSREHSIAIQACMIIHVETP